MAHSTNFWSRVVPVGCRLVENPVGGRAEDEIWLVVYPNLLR
jgi:hypothetical protein